MRYYATLFVTLSLSLTACGTQEPAVYNTYGVSKGAGSTGVHTVLPGDTVYKIANNYQLPMREIITLNNIEAPYVLNTGFRMKLPPPNEHKVRAGDSLTSIARMYELSPNRLARLNDLSAPYIVRQGESLRLPSTNEEVAPTSAVVKNSPVTPDKKPSVQSAPAKVQKASVQRAQALNKVPKQTPKLSGNGKFMQPVSGNILSSYGAKDGGLFNDGINIQAVKGTPVRAAENGVVVYTGDDLAGYGNLVLVRHENKMMSAYAHLDNTLVNRGATVKRGQSIATVGSTGQVDTPQLHFEIRKGSKALDPAKYL